MAVIVVDDPDAPDSVHGVVTSETQLIKFSLTGYTDEARSGNVIKLIPIVLYHSQVVIVRFFCTENRQSIYKHQL